VTWRVLIAHAPGEEKLAERLAAPIRKAGYEVAHRGTVGIGDSIEGEATLALEAGGPVVLCGTSTAVGSRWAWQLVNAARAGAGRTRVFVVQMEREAYVEPLARDGMVAPYWEDPHRALQDLIAALQKHYPLDFASPAQAQSGLIDFTHERLRHGTIFAREAVFRTVEGWMESASRGWILIKGGPGTGKSAILTAILDRLEAERKGAVPHHFLRRGQATWNEPDAILRNLNARLERLVPLDGPLDAQGLDRFQELLARAAVQRPAGTDSAGQGTPGQGAAGRARLVVVVDGLDEAAVPAGETAVLQRFLPAYLPEGVWMLCASRPHYPALGWLEQRSGLRTIDLDQAPWLDDNRQVVEAYWRHHGPRLDPPLGEALQATAVDAARGNILHAVTLHDAFTVNPQFRDPQRLPVGFAALLEEMWLRIVELDDRRTSKQVIDGLGLLAIAAEALPLSIVARLLGWDHPADIVDFKRHALPFLLEESAAWHGGEARYRPFHEATREFLTAGLRMWPEVRRAKEELLARRLAAWPPEDPADDFRRQYAARYAIRHLSAAGDWTRIAELLGDLRFGVAALEALGPQLLLARFAELVSREEPPGLAERAEVLRRILRLESQWLEAHPAELPSLVHNRLLCLGWTRERIRATFSGLERGWGLVAPVDVGQEICIFRGHTSSVKSCALDARGRYGVSGSWDGTARIWDLERGTSLHVLKPDPEALRCDVTSCAMSADGRYAATASSLIRAEPRREFSKVQVWDTRDGQLLHEVEHDTTDEIRVAFAGGDRVLARHTSGLVDILEIASRTTRQLDLGEPISGGIDVDASGRRLAAMSGRGCGVWDLDDGTKRFEVELRQSGLADVCSFSPDGCYLAVATPDSVAVASVADGSILRHTDAISDLSDCRLLSEGRLLFTSGECELVVWDLENDRALARYQGHTYTADCCAATPDGEYALTGGGDNTVRLWSLEEKPTSLGVDRHERLVYGCVLDPAGTLACSTPQDAAPLLWNARTGSRLRPIDTAVTYGSVRFCLLGDDRVKLATLGNTLQVWDPESGRLEAELEIPVDPGTGGVHFTEDLAFARTALLPLLRSDSHVLVWRDQETLEAFDISKDPTFKDPTVSRLDHGRALAILGGDGALEIVRLTEPGSRTTIADGVRSCIGSPRADAVYALLYDDRLCRLGASAGEVQAILGEILQKHVSLRIDAETRALWAHCYDGEFPQQPTNEVLLVFPLDGSGGPRVASVRDHNLFGACFLPGGELVTAGWDATVRVWSPRRSQPTAAVSGSAPFRCVDAAADRIVVGDQKGNVWFLAPLGELYPSG
jgi:WD40 repeat protein